MHENVAEEPPGLGPELGMVGEGTLQEQWAGHLQDQPVQLESIVHEHGNLKRDRRSHFGAAVRGGETSSTSPVALTQLALMYAPLGGPPNQPVNRSSPQAKAMLGWKQCLRHRFRLSVIVCKRC